MKTLQVDLPDPIAREMENAIESGAFENPADVIRAALREFLGQHRLELVERQQMQDIAWALRQSKPGQ